MYLLKNRMQNKISINQLHQAGFRPGFTTYDHVQAINQIIEKALEFQSAVHHNLAFLDSIQ